MSSLELSPRIFVGRRKELALFEKMLANPSHSKWILSIVASGGQGKTQLLDRFIEIVQTRRAAGHKVLVTARPIDFYWTAHQRELGILNSLANQLEYANEFAAFRAQLREYRHLMREEKDPEQLQHSALEARTFFLNGYRDLAEGRRITLLFDTAELAGSALNVFWQKVLPELRLNTLVVIAGRQPITLLPEDQVVQLKIRGFSSEEIAAYFEMQGMDVSDHISQIMELSDGRPILVALIVDWIKEGHALGELLAYDRPEFERAMVQRVEQLSFPEDRAILAMAHLYRRFNEAILAQVLDLSLEDANRIVSNLSRFTFVKYRPAVGDRSSSCLIHDEMRDFINKHIWTSLDPLGEYRHNWSQKMVAYYTDRIQVESDRLAWQSLGLEKLHFLFDIDLEEAFAFSRTLFERAKRNLDTGFMEAINAELTPYQEALSLQMKQEMAFRAAIALHRKENFNTAIEILNQLVDSLQPGALKAESLAYLTEICADSGKPRKALGYGGQCETLCQSLLDQLADESERRQIERILALAYNNLGYAWRTLGNFDRTSEFYEKALQFPRVKLPASFIARLRNNLAYVYYRQGRTDEALSLCKAALQIRLYLAIPYELGLSYNVLGMIYAGIDRIREAVRAFEDAIDQMSEARNERGKGLVYIAYGRLLRQLGWYEETEELTDVIDGTRNSSFAEEVTDVEVQISRNREYRKSKELLERAEVIFDSFSDWSNRAKALNELGCLYRQVEDKRKAVEYLQESVRCAKEGNNRLRETDSLLDLAITYYRLGDPVRASEHAVRSRDIAREEGADYLFSKAQHVLADIAFKEGNYDQAFEAAADSCVYVVREYTKDRAYLEVVDWVVSLIEKLPSSELAREKSLFLADRWRREGLEESYPGFIVRINSVAQDYLLWATDFGGEND